MGRSTWSFFPATDAGALSRAHEDQHFAEEPPNQWGQDSKLEGVRSRPLRVEGSPFPFPRSRPDSVLCSSSMAGSPRNHQCFPASGTKVRAMRQPDVAAKGVRGRFHAGPSPLSLPLPLPPSEWTPGRWACQHAWNPGTGRTWSHSLSPRRHP